MAAKPPVELHVISDSTGETAARLVLALEAQFPEQAFEEDLRYARAVTYEDWRNRGPLTRVRELLALPIRSQM